MSKTKGLGNYRQSTIECTGGLQTRTCRERATLSDERTEDTVL